MVTKRGVVIMEKKEKRYSPYCEYINKQYHDGKNKYTLSFPETMAVIFLLCIAVLFMVNYENKKSTHTGKGNTVYLEMATGQKGK